MLSPKYHDAVESCPPNAEGVYWGERWKMGILLTILTIGLVGCGNSDDTTLGRANPFDRGDAITLSSLLVGSWSRSDAEKNQVYTFKNDGRAELRDYSSPDGTAVDRNGAYPQTLVFSFTGTYTTVGNLLRITFTDVQTNDPSGETPLLRDKIVNIRITDDELTLEELDGDRVYTRI